jgi:hypothetical protein
MFREEDPDAVQAIRSWHTRMASVIRQFDALTKEEVMSDLGPVSILGFIRSGSTTMLSVCLDFETCKITSIEPDQVIPFV